MTVNCKKLLWKLFNFATLLRTLNGDGQFVRDNVDMINAIKSPFNEMINVMKVACQSAERGRNSLSI